MVELRSVVRWERVSKAMRELRSAVRRAWQ
jgi:hypothetical protein